jgi:hypothetical protein
MGEEGSVHMFMSSHITEQRKLALVVCERGQVYMISLSEYYKRYQYSRSKYKEFCCRNVNAVPVLLLFIIITSQSAATCTGSSVRCDSDANICHDTVSLSQPMSRSSVELPPHGSCPS